MAQRRVDTLGSHLSAAPPAAAPSSSGGGGDAVPLHHKLSQIPAGPPGPKVRLTDAEKRQLYNDGFLILRGAIPRELTERARRRWNVTAPKDRGGGNAVGSRIGTSQEITDLITKSCITDLLKNEMGPFSPPVSGMVAVTPPLRQNSAAELPPSDERPAWPEYGCPGLHVEGSWTGPTPRTQDKLNPATGKPYDVAKYLGDESADVIGTNVGPLWQDREKTLSLGSFTTFVIVALNNQTIPGRGQTALARGGHHEAAKFFRWQRDQGGAIGPEGPGWPRFSPIGKKYVTITYIPDRLRNALAARCGGVEENGVMWPKPTPVLMEEGDVALTLYSCPHGASMNFGPDPRMNIIFRIRRARDGDPNEGSRRQATGTSDHPDRQFFGKFLNYPPGYDPFKISKEKMCDPWSEWQGMARIVAEEEAKERAAGGAR